MPCKKNKRNKGQSIVEYAGMIVMSTLLVGGMMSSAKQLMPVIFTALAHNNAAALSDAPPAPASSMRSPAPLSSLAHDFAPSSPSVQPMALPMPLAQIASPQFEIPETPQLTISKLNSGKPASPAATTPAATATPASGPRPAMPPHVFPGPSPAPTPAMAPPPKLAPGPTPAPIPNPAPTS
jgi:hypothetical protein